MKWTYTKKLTRNLLIVGAINGTMPFVLSYLDKDPVYALGETWVLGIVAVCLGYFVRGFKDSKEASNDDYRRKRLERRMEDYE